MGAELQSIEPLRAIIETAPLGIFCDIDGTIAPIVQDPAAAAVSPLARRLLEQLIGRGVRVVLVSGRDLETARAIVGIEDAAYAGNHGLELWIDGRREAPEDARKYELQARQVLAQVGSLDWPGVLVEDKGPVLAFHYRNADDQERAKETILAALRVAPATREFGVYHGRKVIELRPPLDINKGTVIAELAGRLGLRSALALGDDMTDIDMFRGIERLRSRALAGASIAAWSEEGSPQLLSVTDYWVRGVPGVEWLLAEVVRALPERQPEGPGTATPAST